MNWFIAHLIGDYLLQTDRMAEGKKKDSWICTEHVAFYMLPFLMLVDLTWQQFFFIAVQHWMLDRTQVVEHLMTNVTGHKNFAQNPLYRPWSLIIHDNVWHLVWLYIIIEKGIPL